MSRSPFFVEQMRPHAGARPNDVALIAPDGRLTWGALFARWVTVSISPSLADEPTSGHLNDGAE